MASFGFSERRPIGAVLLMTLLLMTGGCIDAHITDAVTVMNGTDQVLHFEIVTEKGIPFDLNTTVRPGETVRLLDGSQLSDGAGLTRNRCTVGELRAIASDGRVVSRLSPPICAPTKIVIPQGAGSS